jgi:hypothetical protein
MRNGRLSDEYQVIRTMNARIREGELEKIVSESSLQQVQEKPYTNKKEISLIPPTRLDSKFF